MSYLLGLTGSIGMGKSTTAALFADRGCLVWDADSTVHHAYGPKGVAVGAIAKIAASAVGSNGVNRDQLRQLISKDPALLPQIEAIIHPIVQQDRQYFIASNPNLILVFDIPLLFELNSEAAFDAVACVLAPSAAQKARVMERPGMTEAHFTMINGKQLPTTVKAARADYIIDTTSFETATTSVEFVLKDIKRKLENA